jgi:Ca2+-binding RTX toxin-like protein
MRVAVTARQRLALLAISLAAFLAAPGTALAVVVSYQPDRLGGTVLYVNDPAGLGNSVTVANGLPVPGAIQHVVTDTAGVTSASPMCVVETQSTARCTISDSTPPPSGIFTQVYVSLGKNRDQLDMSTLVPGRPGATRSAIAEGGTGPDRIVGATGSDVINGGRGRDLLIGGGGGDSIDAEAGNDSVFGGEGDDFLRGRPGDDRLFGQQGREHLNGSKGRRDRCVGGPGSEHVINCERGDPNN